MIPDLDDLLKQLEELLAATLRDIEAGKSVRRHVVVGDDLFKVTTSITITQAADFAARPPPTRREPIVDVIEGEDTLRVVVELPGVRKENVNVGFADGLLRIDVVKDGGELHHVEVPCKVAPGEIRVESKKENNSVVEITFKRTKKKEGSGDR